MSLARLAHVNFFAATAISDVFTEQINDDDDDDEWFVGDGQNKKNK